MVKKKKKHVKTHANRLTKETYSTVKKYSLFPNFLLFHNLKKRNRWETTSLSSVCPDKTKQTKKKLFLRLRESSKQQWEPLSKCDGQELLCCFGTRAACYGWWSHEFCPLPKGECLAISFCPKVQMHLRWQWSETHLQLYLWFGRSTTFILEPLKVQAQKPQKYPMWLNYIKFCN